MASILIVEDDEHLRMALRAVLESARHTVDEATDGIEAQKKIQTGGNYAVVISDIQMPNMSGVDLLQWVKANHPTPFILMTGFSAIMESQKAERLGADDFIAKPFSHDDLMASLARILADDYRPGKEGPLSAEDLCKVPLTEFVTTRCLQFDVYVLLGNRYVKIGHKGDPIPADRIQNYRFRGLRFLYTLREEFRKVVLFNVHLSKQLKTSQIPAEKKAHFLRYTAETIMEKAFVNGVDEESFDVAKDFVNSTIDVISGEDESFILLNALNNHSDYLYAHSLCVSVYAVMIARRCGIESSQTLYKLGLCGLYHNVGMKEVSRVLLAKPRSQLTVDERKHIESHVQRGREILMSVPNIPEEVVQVAFQHHENDAGTGFPQSLRRPQIHPLVRYIRTADVFAELVLKQPDGSAGLPPKQALNKIIMGHTGTLDPKTIEALASMFIGSRAA